MNSNIISELKTLKNILIYGTGEILSTTCKFLNEFGVLGDTISVKESDISDDKTIKELVAKINDTTNLIVATKMEYKAEIMKKLSSYNINNALFITSEVYFSLKSEYLNKCYRDNGNKLTMLSELTENSEKFIYNNYLKIFMVKCAKDKFLENKFDLPSWISPIQAGKYNANIQVADITDNIGDNISSRNSSYCELTAMYWIWKNTNYKYIGLCHYRRHFIINESGVAYIENSDIDVVLPVPSVCCGSVKDYYYRNHIPSHWDIMMNLLKEKHFEYYKTAKVVFDKDLYYACNMLIAKREVFDEYCSWLFEILFELEKLCEPQNDSYQSRYIGFLAERLTSLYFMHNRDKLKIVHAVKNFI